MNNMTIQDSTHYSNRIELEVFKACPECHSTDVITIREATGCRDCGRVDTSHKFDAVNRDGEIEHL